MYLHRGGALHSSWVIATFSVFSQRPENAAKGSPAVIDSIFDLHSPQKPATAYLDWAACTRGRPARFQPSAAGSLAAAHISWSGTQSAKAPRPTGCLCAGECCPHRHRKAPCFAPSRTSAALHLAANRSPLPFAKVADRRQAEPSARQLAEL